MTKKKTQKKSSKTAVSAPQKNAIDDKTVQTYQNGVNQLNIAKSNLQLSFDQVRDLPDTEQIVVTKWLYMTLTNVLEQIRLGTVAEIERLKNPKKKDK